MKKKTLILASTSPRRQELIHHLKQPVQILASEVDESIDPSYQPAHIVEQLALRKAMATAKRLQPDNQYDIVIGADTVVVLADQILGKPEDQQDAVHMLLSLQGNWHEVYSGVACIDLETNQTIVSHRKTRVKMKHLTLDQIQRYVETGEPMDKAGAYAIQGFGSVLIDAIDGCYFNVVGLPISLLCDMLDELGIHVL